MDQILQLLQQRIENIEKWQREKDAQQIKYPLDVRSVAILQKYFMRIIDTIFTEGGAGGNTFVNYLGSQDEKVFLVAQNTFFPYQVDVASNVFTTSNVEMQDDMMVYVASSGTPPSPLDTLVQYFVVNASGKTFQLSLTQGGAAINITDTGSGNQYLYFF